MWWGALGNESAFVENNGVFSLSDVRIIFQLQTGQLIVTFSYRLIIGYIHHGDIKVSKLDNIWISLVENRFFMRVLMWL